jgi:ligand-binding SRPBCC domain-containing protein
VKEETYVRRTRMPVSAEELFRWHAAPGALRRLTPPWEPVEVMGEDRGLAAGQEIELRVRLGPLSLPWIARVVEVVPGRSFTDRQVKGPFTSWQHAHRMESAGPSASYLEDRVTYVLPGWAPGRWVAGRMVRRRLERLFDYRHKVTAEALAGRPDVGR